MVRGKLVLLSALVVAGGQAYGAPRGKGKGKGEREAAGEHRVDAEAKERRERAAEVEGKDPKMEAIRNVALQASGFHNEVTLQDFKRKVLGEEAAEHRAFEDLVVIDTMVGGEIQQKAIIDYVQLLRMTPSIGENSKGGGTFNGLKPTFIKEVLSTWKDANRDNFIASLRLAVEIAGQNRGWTAKEAFMKALEEKGLLEEYMKQCGG